MKHLVLGILAHVDAGKTTLSEAMLYHTGSLRKLGRVDHGTTFLDTDTIEKARGITIFSKEALLQLDNTALTLLDTPGHVDFSAEMERCLCALDYAVLVVSGTDGVQSHTETLWKLLAHYQIPTFLFVNKMDLAQPDRKEALLGELKARLSPNCVDFTAATASGVQTMRDGKPVPYDATADEAQTRRGGVAPPVSDAQAQWQEDLSLCDETLMEQALNGEPLTTPAIADAIARRQVFPCYFGAALKLDGIAPLLNGLDAYTVQPPAGKEFAARVFKITEDATGARLTWVKVMGGSLAAKTILEGRADGAHSTQGAARFKPTNTAKPASDTSANGEGTTTKNTAPPWREKVDQIRLYSGDKYTQTDVLYPGMAAALTGLTACQIGEGLGAAPSAPTPMLEPVLNYTVILPAGGDTHTVLRALQTIAGEDPQLRVAFQPALGEIHLQLMGEVQLEVMQSLLAERFGLAVSFGQGRILYKETIAKGVEGIGHYEPLRHYAETHLAIEPLPQGSGVVLATTCHVDDLGRNWQNLILTHLAEKTHAGVLIGAPLTDVKITLIAGRAHLKHTEGGDFREATYRAVRHGLRCTESVLLEPWYHFALEVPADQIGRAMADVQRMAGEFAPPDLGETTATLTGSAPVATMRTYAAELAGYTRGRGRITLTLQGYAPCHNAAAVIADAAYDPDADAENPCGSVFCSHGAGYFVPWEQVAATAHIDTEWGKEAQEVYVPQATQRRAERYSGTLAQDKELLAIFEKTYGKINRDPRRAFTKPSGTENPSPTMSPQPGGDKPVGEGSPLPQGSHKTNRTGDGFLSQKNRTGDGSLSQKSDGASVGDGFSVPQGQHKPDGRPQVAPTSASRQGAKPTLPQGPEYLLVDGYNVLHAWDDLAKMAQENLETARRRLMDMLCNYQGYRKVNLILVFDAYRVKGNLGTVEQYHGIKVVYTKEAETADTYIERVTHGMAKQHRVRVVTSDASMQYIILGNGALRVSARAFRQEIDQTEKEIREYLER